MAKRSEEYRPRRRRTDWRKHLNNAEARMVERYETMKDRLRELGPEYRRIMQRAMKMALYYDDKK
jgi:hypothetical protein